MTRKQVLISMIATLIVALAMAAPAAAVPPDYSSPTAILGARGVSESGATQSPLDRSNYSSPAAILGARGVGEPSAPAVVEVSDSSGFDWGAALIGAGIAFGVLLLAFATFRFTRQRRHPITTS